MSALKKTVPVSIPKSGGETPLAHFIEREVFGLLGIPIDIVEMNQVVDRLIAAKARKTPFVLSTPNVNFLIQSQADQNFRETLLASDLCTADGTPIVWLAKALGIPLRRRVPGSDIFDALKRRQDGPPIRVFFFGGAEGVADKVARKINSECQGMRCVGSISPGYGTVEQMSSSPVLEQINSSNADFVAIFLSSKKGQEWVMYNAHALHVPVRAQLGATINFQAGTVRRAPAILRSTGFEWLWRIKQEPFLWQRYWQDGLALTWMGLSRVLPIMLLRRTAPANEGVEVKLTFDGLYAKLQICGCATLPNIQRLQQAFLEAFAKKSGLIIDLSGVIDIDPRFFGLLIVVRKITRASGCDLRIVNPRAAIRRLFKLHGFTYLLTNVR